MERLWQRYGIKNHASKMGWFDTEYMKYYDEPEKCIGSDLFGAEPIMRLGKPYPKEISCILT